MCIHVHLEADIAALVAFELLRAAIRPWPAAHDAHLTNLERTSSCHPTEGVKADVLASEVHLGQHISASMLISVLDRIK